MRAGTLGTVDRARAPDILFALALAAVPAGVALAVRALEPVQLADSALPWLPAAFTATLGLVAALAALAALVRALRSGSVASLLESGASAALAGGAVVTLTGTGSMAAPVLASGVFLAAASVVGSRAIAGGPTR